ncbi:MAG: hypothetical protein M4579_003732 [Chaenotheca gracillima]|nr:MAG: hypothetical protein M4579_003732 [Chaenotheca gracillima]
MDVFFSYCYGSAAWLTIQAVPLIVSPSMIIPMLSSGMRDATDVETYLSRSLGFALITLAIFSILLTGSIPLTPSLSENPSPDNADPAAPYAVPTLTTTLIYHTSLAFYSYTRWASHGTFAFAAGTAGSGLFAALGLWCLLFGSSSGKISKRSGADKRTSGWPFGNAEADKKRKNR